jgi:4-hydroxybenzoate polyprenyltransferase
MNNTSHIKTPKVQNNLSLRWATFVWERYNPFLNVSFSVLFFLAHYLITEKTEPISYVKVLLLLVGVSVFLFKLRLFDEIKDFEYDSVAYPTRPLPRGAIFHEDIYWGIALLTFFEYLLFNAFGTASLFAIFIADTYSLLMFKEFFARKWIRPKLILYAITHTFVVGLLSLSIFSALTAKPIWGLDCSAYVFSAISWLLFNVYEFGRKSFIPEEENIKADSYSKNYGRPIASLLVTINVVVVIPLANTILSSMTFLYILTLIFFTLSILFAVFNRKPFGKLFRAGSFLFIFTFYLIVIIAHL